MGNWRWLIVAVVMCLAAGQVGWAADRPATVTSSGSVAGSTAPAVPWEEIARMQVFDEKMLARATERGEALLKGTRWEASIPFRTLTYAGTLYDAGDLVIWTRESDSSSVALDKATGNQAWSMTDVKIKAVSAGAKGAEMVVTRSERTGSGLGIAGRAGTDTMEIMSVADRAGKWKKTIESFTSVFLTTPKQVFTGMVIPPTFADGPQGSWVWPATRTSILAAYDRASGDRQWTYTLPAELLNTRSLAFSDGVLYVLAAPFSANGNPPCTLIAINSTDGQPIFVSPPPHEYLSPLVVKDNVVIASNSSGEVVGFDTKTGQEKWRERISLSEEPVKATLKGQVEMDQAPVVDGDILLVSTRGLSSNATARRGESFNETLGLAAFDIKTHKQQWFFRPPADTLSSLHGVQVEKGKIIGAVTGIRRGYVGADMKTGKLDWQIPLTAQIDHGSVVTMPLFSGGVMYIMKDGKLIAVPLGTK